MVAVVYSKIDDNEFEIGFTEERVYNRLITVNFLWADVDPDAQKQREKNQRHVMDRLCDFVESNPHLLMIGE